MLALRLNLRIMRGPVKVDGRFDMSPDSEIGYQTMFPIGELCKNGYTLPSIVMGMRSNHFVYKIIGALVSCRTKESVSVLKRLIIV
ncbi:hypothetical protein DET57_111187 [Klebsiella oxytoca]|uniref:Uncharacterized protein n=1 Tax=Klebsiella oxytoca TaxID=571 RepID=A0A318FMX5_KLEOX|nr:hypothetical protein DET57_111187 [Klebsiella oxytoca]